jgi:hypothetical protein
MFGSSAPRDGSRNRFSREGLFPPGPVVADPVYLMTYVRSVIRGSIGDIRSS